MPSLQISALLAVAAGLVFAAPPVLYLLRSLHGDLNQVRSRWLRLTRDPGVLLAVYLAGSPSLIADDGEATGDKPALVVFSSPFCRHCVTFHKAVHALSSDVGVTIRLLTLTESAASEDSDFLDVERAIRPFEMIALLYAVANTRGAAAFHAALTQVFSAQDAFRRLSPRAVVARLGFLAEEIRPALAAGFDRLRRDAAIARTANIERTPALFLNGRPLPEWMTPEQLPGLVGSVVRATATPD